MEQPSHRERLMIALSLVALAGFASACQPVADAPGQAQATHADFSEEVETGLKPAARQEEDESQSAIPASNEPTGPAIGDSAKSGSESESQQPAGPETDRPVDSETPKPSDTATDQLGEEAAEETPGDAWQNLPLVDDPETLQRLHPNYPVWIDRESKQVIMVGQVCQRYAPLELFACLRGSKEHESVVAIDTKAYVVHAGLLATGAEAGSPAKYVPEYVPASGTEIEVEVVWEDEQGDRRRARAQDWVRDVGGLYSMFDGVVPNDVDDELNVDDQIAASKSMTQPWVFAGSQFLQDERTGRQHYLADSEGELICVSNFPSAVLDLPIKSSDSNTSLLFQAYTERIPPLGTPVTLILTPKRPAKAESSQARLPLSPLQ